jgi:hypothetical protein
MVLLIALGVFSSYSVSKGLAERIAQVSRMPISPLKGRLIVLIDDEFLFRKWADGNGFYWVAYKKAFKV